MNDNQIKCLNDIYCFVHDIDHHVNVIFATVCCILVIQILDIVFRRK